MKGDNRVRGDNPPVSHDRRVLTPAYVLSEQTLKTSLDAFCRISRETGCRILFALKSSSLVAALEMMRGRVHGFSASSPFEARLGREVIGGDGTIHLTAPGLKEDAIPVINEVCDYLSFNSLSQWERLARRVSAKVTCGLRVNPQISFVKDLRYDPCRSHSKLGEPLPALLRAIDRHGGSLPRIEGIHFHTNCDSTDYGQLLRTVRTIERSLGPLLTHLTWVNLGGGYLLENARNFDALYEALAMLQSGYGLTLFLEPGSAIIREAVSLVTTVTDLFHRDGKAIAILDTTVNHMPEIFEYQFRPVIRGEEQTGEFPYTLAGATCLAGDLFGEFRFGEPLEIGTRLVFEHMGSYTLAKARMFSGINMPSIYRVGPRGAMKLVKHFDYADFLAHWR